VLLGIRWRSLRLKIIAWSFVPSAIILVAVALVGFYAYQRITEDLTFEKNREFSRRIAGQLAVELGEFTSQLSSLARAENIYRGVIPIQQLALKQAGNRLTIFDAGAIILDDHGACGRSGTGTPRDYGAGLVESSLLSPDGACARAGLVGHLNDGPDGAQVIVVAVPITGPRNEFVGLWLACFDWGPSTPVPFMPQSSNFELVKRSSFSECLPGRSERTGRLSFRPSTNRKRSFRQAAVQQVLSGKSGALRTRDLTGQEIVASFAPVPVPNTPWGLVTELS